MVGTDMADDQMDDETLIIPSRPIPSKAVINFAELHQIRDILYVPTDSYTTGTAALSRWGRLAVHTKYSCSPFPLLFLRLSLTLILSPSSLFSSMSHLCPQPPLPCSECSTLAVSLTFYLSHPLLLPLSSPPLILFSVIPYC